MREQSPTAVLIASTILFLFIKKNHQTGVSSIRVSQLMVPRQVGRGHDAQLHCHFNLGGNILYSVKWYKGISTPHCAIFSPSNKSVSDCNTTVFNFKTSSQPIFDICFTGSREFFRVVPDGARSFQVFPHLSNLTVDVINFSLSFSLPTCYCIILKGLKARILKMQRLLTNGRDNMS